LNISLIILYLLGRSVKRFSIIYQNNEYIFIVLAA
jgi:hypothetical protein